MTAEEKWTEADTDGNINVPDYLDKLFNNTFAWILTMWDIKHVIAIHQVDLYKDMLGEKAMTEQRDELVSVLQDLMQHYEINGQLLSWNVDKARQILNKLNHLNNGK